MFTDHTFQPSEEARRILVLDAARQMNDSLELTTVLATALDAVRQLFVADRAAIYQLESTGRLACLASVGLSPTFLDAACRAGAEAPLFRAAHRSGRPTFASQVGDDFPNLPLARLAVSEDISSAFLLPLVHHERFAGCIGVYHDHPHAYSSEDEQLALDLATHTAAAMENARLYQIAQEQAREITALYDASKRLMESLDLSETLANLLDSIVNLTESMAVGIALQDPEDNRFSFVATRGPRGATFDGISFGPGEGLVGTVAQHGQPVRVDDAEIETRWRNGVEVRAGGIRSAYFLPLLRRGNVIGVLAAYSEVPSHFTPRRERMLRGLADHAALALARAQGLARREKAEQALRESEERFRALVQNSSDLVSVLDAEGIVRYQSPSIERILGYPVAHWPDANNFALVHPDDLPFVQKAFEQVVKHPGQSVTLTYRYQHADGHWVFLESVGQNQLDNPHIRGIVVNSRDVSERVAADEAQRKATQRLEVAIRELRAAQQQIGQQERLRALGRMASGIAHDFNNALAKIIGFSDLLLSVYPERMRDPETVKSHLEWIGIAASDAAASVNQLREFYRFQSDPSLLPLVDLNRVVTDAVSLTRPRWHDQALASGQTIQVLTELTQLPLIAADEAQLRTALTNLIFNAVDALPNGGIVVIRTRSEDDHVTLSVSDDGVGMTEDVRAHCLEPFFTTKGIAGTGMGLATVYGTVQRHGATIDIAGELGRGTVVTIHFPIGAMLAPSDFVELSQKAAPTCPRRILLAEDDPAIRHVLASFLQADGHVVEAVVDGAEAAERFRPDAYDIVITDRAMPRLSGDQLARTIKQRSPATPIMLITGFGDMMNAAEERPSMFDLIVGKPIDIEGLRQAMVKVFG